jgi:hypothetical protein
VNVCDRGRGKQTDAASNVQANTQGPLHCQNQADDVPCVTLAVESSSQAREGQATKKKRHSQGRDWQLTIGSGFMSVPTHLLLVVKLVVIDNQQLVAIHPTEQSQLRGSFGQQPCHTVPQGGNFPAPGGLQGAQNKRGGQRWASKQVLK